MLHHCCTSLLIIFSRNLIAFTKICNIKNVQCVIFFEIDIFKEISNPPENLFFESRYLVYKTRNILVLSLEFYIKGLISLIPRFH